MLRCEDGNCTCQPVPIEPLYPPPVEIYLSGSKPDQIRALHQPESEFDFSFDIDNSVMLIRDVIVDHSKEYTYGTTYVQFDTKNSTFVNLQGMTDNSLVLTLRLKPSFCEGKSLRFREKKSVFLPVKVPSRLASELLVCDWEERIVQIVFPEGRVHGWKTVALILLTFNRVSMENWCSLVRMMGEPPVAGLDWQEIVRSVKVNDERDMREARRARMKWVGHYDDEVQTAFKTLAPYSYTWKK